MLHQCWERVCAVLSVNSFLARLDRAQATHCTWGLRLWHLQCWVCAVACCLKHNCLNQRSPISLAFFFSYLLVPTCFQALMQLQFLTRLFLFVYSYFSAKETDNDWGKGFTTDPPFVYLRRRNVIIPLLWRSSSRKPLPEGLSPRSKSLIDSCEDTPICSSEGCASAESRERCLLLILGDMLGNQHNFDIEHVTHAALQF